MAKISEDQIHASYTEAVSHYRGEKRFSEAITELVENHDMNLASARDFLNNFKKIMTGEAYNRTLSGSATRYFLNNIEATFGIDQLKIALMAVDGHIKYYESLKHGKLKNIRNIYNEFKGHIPDTICLDKLNIEFEEKVSTSIKDGGKKRAKRLSSSPKKPTTSTVTVTTYKRNPDVVAEVLIRAAGQCENCHKPAPFIRKKDGTPYLEVHHKHQLAHGGYDTVDNAVAVCPNCHREQHFG